MAKKRGMSLQTRVLMVFSLLASIVFLPTTIILAIGMLPTLAAIFIDRTSEKTRGLTVGAMNLAGCMPFILQVWMGKNLPDQAFSIIAKPQTVVVIYCAAGVGYLLDWAISGLVASIMVQAGTARAAGIKRRQAELVERWGKEVTGEIPTDRHGFPLEEDASEPEKLKNAR